jgi:hypothetical protein
MKLFLRWGRTRGPRPSHTHRIQPISAGMGEVYPRRAFPRDGPVPLRRNSVRAPPSGPATGKASSLRKPRFRPTLFNTPTLCVLCASDLPTDDFAPYARRKLGWAGLCTVRNANSTHAAHRRALLIRMACTSIGRCGRTSARLAGAPYGSTLAAPLPFAVRSCPTADGRRERADFCRWPYIRCIGCVPTPAPHVCTHWMRLPPPAPCTAIRRHVSTGLKRSSPQRVVADRSCARHTEPSPARRWPHPHSAGRHSHPRCRLLATGIVVCA